jgi:Na+/proline symporter
MNSALPFIISAALLALGLGFLAGRGKDMNLEQWTVGGRSFGALFVFLLLAGEIYTTFTFLGGSGFAYGKGAPAFVAGRLRYAAGVATASTVFQDYPPGRSDSRHQTGADDLYFIGPPCRQRAK